MNHIKAKPILIRVPKQESFNVPEGRHRALTREVFVIDRPYKDLSEQTLRIKWHLPLLDEPAVEYVVAKNYPLTLESHHDLRKDINSWLGHNGIQKLLVNGQLDANKLIGMEADIRTQHGPDRGFKHPYVNIVEIVPAGTYTTPEPEKPAPCLKSLRELLN